MACPYFSALIEIPLSSGNATASFGQPSKNTKRGEKKELEKPKGGNQLQQQSLLATHKEVRIIKP